MKWWCLVLAIGLLQVAVFLETTEAKRGRDTDGDGTPDQGNNKTNHQPIPKPKPKPKPKKIQSQVKKDWFLN
jgi:hypothetical protein